MENQQEVCYQQENESWGCLSAIILGFVIPAIITSMNNDSNYCGPECERMIQEMKEGEEEDYHSREVEYEQMQYQSHSEYNSNGLDINLIRMQTKQCSIKGNVSYKTGEKIYHLPNQESYADTIIRPEYGERYFCTEQEARNAGFRRAYN